MQHLISQLSALSISTLYSYLFTVICFVVVLDVLYRGYYKGVLQFAITHTNKKMVVVFLGLLFLIIKYFDYPVAIYMSMHYSRQFFWVIDTLSQIAMGNIIGGIVCFIIIIGTILKHKASVAKISLIAMLYSGVINSILKMIFSRQRPSFGYHQWYFFHFLISHNYHDLWYKTNSMPSGHTITICAGLTPFFLATKSYVAKIMLILICIIVVFGRVYTLNHWLSDVYVASVIGLWLGYASYKVNYPKKLS